MKPISIEMSIKLRTAFKTACVINNISMKDALINEVDKILDKNEPCYITHRPPNGENMCLLCFNANDDFLNKVKDRKANSGDKIRDIYITGIINYLITHDDDIDYDFSEDIYEE